MARVESPSSRPARVRRGLPIIPDGSQVSPLLLRLSEGDEQGACNNGCVDCLTRPEQGPEAAPDVAIKDRYVVLRDREPLLRRDLPRILSGLRARGPASVAVLTNGRLLGYEALTRRVVQAGADTFIVKIFGRDAASHDAHTRDAGSFEQALHGARVASAAGAKVFFTFPVFVEPGPDEKPEKAARTAFAREHTGRDAVEFPEPQVAAHGGEFRFDVMYTAPGIVDDLWADKYFPMVHVSTGPVCNIRCTYCNVYGGDDQRTFEEDYIRSMLDAAAAAVLPKRDGGHRHTVDFIGGEPTLHPKLPALVSYARQKGFPDVTICTNGTLLHRPGYLDELVRAGLTGVRYSLHEHRAEKANELADVGGLGSRYVDVAKLLLGRKDLKTYIYRILLSSTLDSLEDYVRFVAEHNAGGQPADLILGMPSLRGRMHDNGHLYPALGLVREATTRAVSLAESLGLRTTIFHAPGCVVPGAARLHACLHVVNDQHETLSDEVNRSQLEGDTAYGEACSTCEGKALGCQGLPVAYFEADRAEAEAWLRPLSYDPTVLSAD